MLWVSPVLTACLLLQSPEQSGEQSPELPPAPPPPSFVQPPAPPQLPLDNTVAPLEGTTVAPAPAPQAAVVPPPPAITAPPMAPQPDRTARPWWGLGVPERAYRMVRPQGPDTGSLNAQQASAFWEQYTLLRQESFLLDAAELGVLAIPAFVFLAGAAVLPVLSLPGLAERFGQRGSTADKLVGTAFILTPVVSLVTAAAAGLCLLVFTGLTTLDAQDNGSPPAPARATPEGNKAVSQASRGSRRNLVLAGALVAVSLPVSLLAFVVPFAAPLALGALFGQSPRTMLGAYLRALNGGSNGPLFGWSAVGSFAAVAALNAGIPAVMAAGYATQALPGVLGWDDSTVTKDAVEGDDRDLSSFLNPADFLFGRRRTTPTPEPAPTEENPDPELQPAPQR